MKNNNKNAFPAPPVAPRKETAAADPYAWLRADNWQDVLRDPSVLDPEIRTYLEAENTYTDAAMAPLENLRRDLVREMRGRIKEDDALPLLRALSRRRRTPALLPYRWR